MGGTVAVILDEAGGVEVQIHIVVAVDVGPFRGLPDHTRSQLEFSPHGLPAGADLEAQLPPGGPAVVPARQQVLGHGIIQAQVLLRVHEGIGRLGILGLIVVQDTGTEPPAAQPKIRGEHEPGLVQILVTGRTVVPYVSEGVVAALPAQVFDQGALEESCPEKVVRPVLVQIDGYRIVQLAGPGPDQGPQFEPAHLATEADHSRIVRL